MLPFGTSSQCPRCQKTVYAAEQVVGPGRRVYHKSCLTCFACKRRLDSFSLVEHDSEPYCRQCHLKHFGTRDLRSANISPTVSPSKTLTETPISIPEEEIALFDETLSKTNADSQQAKGSEGQDAQSSTTTEAESSLPMASQSTGNVFQFRQALKPTMTGGYYGRSNGTRGTTTFVTGTPKCPKCSKSVYFAEQVIAIGQKFHKSCLLCESCGKRLDSYSLLENSGKPYCNTCHRRNFGIRDLRSANLSPS